MDYGLAEESAGSESKVPKVLVAAVIIMGVLIVVGVIGLVGAVIYKATHHPMRTPPSGTAFVQPSPLALPLGAGEHIGAVVSRSDGTLAITLESPHGVRVLLWSPENGRIMGELDLGAPSYP